MVIFSPFHDKKNCPSLRFYVIYISKYLIFPSEISGKKRSPVIANFQFFGQQACRNFVQLKKMCPYTPFFNKQLYSSSGLKVA